MTVKFFIFDEIDVKNIIVPANLVPAAAVIREGLALPEIIGRIGFVDGKAG